jgi:hypothetical protein
MTLIDLEGAIVADTLREARAGTPFPYKDLVDRAAEAGKAAGVRVMPDGKPYQIVVVPVLAPLPIAWVAMSFVIDDKFARDLQRLTSSEVSFVEVGERPRILATTLSLVRSEDLLAEVRLLAVSARQGTTAKIGPDEYEVLATPLDDTAGSGIFAIVQRSVAEGLARISCCRWCCSFSRACRSR